MPNRLAGETSPYLRQHADNPVDWHPWGEQALTLAREQDKPILLSIGYSACHWCHVMAHESFEDAATAAAMNERFVNIKVDREERPDLDHIYQRAHAILTGRSGGWPLTMFLTPAQVPFFGGTYFPATARYGLPAFRDLLLRVSEYYRTRRAEISQQGLVLLDSLRHGMPATEAGAVPNEQTIAEGLLQFEAICDWDNGGFGSSPKFPNPAVLELCLREGADSNPAALEMALRALRGMAQGGIYDQLGGGFCRYSVDARWTIPHFEKMLYDNGQLLGLYADAWCLCGEPLFAQVAEETAAWVLREMRAGDGAFYSSLDADAGGKEGSFYVWQREQLRAVLHEREYALLERYYGLDTSPNFEHETWHLCVAYDLETAAGQAGIPVGDAANLLAAARGKLLAVRGQRVRPARDDKILASWNALMIKGLARAGRVLQRKEWITAAQQAVDALHGTMWVEGRLFATRSEGRVHLDAYLDDYAFLLDALLELLQAEYRPADWTFATELADALLRDFQDNGGGGFFFTRHDHEALIYRFKNGHDNATPAGNGIAAFALQRFGHLAGRADCLAAAVRTLSCFDGLLQQSPAACPTLLMALRESLMPPTLVIVRGESADLARWRQELGRQYRPHVLPLFLENGANALPPALDKPAQGRVNAWVCRGVSCLPAIDDLNELFAAL